MIIFNYSKSKSKRTRKYKELVDFFRGSISISIQIHCQSRRISINSKNWLLFFIFEYKMKKSPVSVSFRHRSEVVEVLASQHRAPAWAAWKRRRPSFRRKHTGVEASRTRRHFSFVSRLCSRWFFIHSLTHHLLLMFSFVSSLLIHFHIKKHWNKFKYFYKQSDWLTIQVIMHFFLQGRQKDSLSSHFST